MFLCLGLKPFAMICTLCSAKGFDSFILYSGLVGDLLGKLNAQRPKLANPTGVQKAEGKVEDEAEDLVPCKGKPHLSFTSASCYW